jgi:hypothetical protein
MLRSTGHTCTSALTALSGEDFSTLAAALTTAFGPLDTFDDLPEKSIIVAPNNEAFATALDGLNLTPEELLGNTELLNLVLGHHVGAVADDGSISDLGGHPMKIMVDGMEVPLEDAATFTEVMIEDEDGQAPVAATTPISCFGGNQLIFPSSGVILPKAEEQAEETKTPGAEEQAEETKTPGAEVAREEIEEGKLGSAASLATGIVAAAMGLVATVF